MHLFYSPVIREGTFTLDSGESLHCTRVLRLRQGDIIHITDGAGRIQSAEIVIPDKNKCVVRITDEQQMPPERGFHLQIAIAPTKSIDRFEWFLEKATEIGIDIITPVICSNSERRIVKPERCRKVMVAAMKQSLSAWLPSIEDTVSFMEFLKKPFGGTRIIATGSAPPHNHPGRYCAPGNPVQILIGPEGDFTDDEMQSAIQTGFIPASLSQKRLRTETAGVVACHAVSFINQPGQ
ncbi:MAG: 16S rRNA (uracil(1498)-N(3))-methyltransferase [Marinilabiliales bacterium]|nr:MAG: 16S rRNA (uracil(1498)-N(3))-methyltransferase [Marinilabiliales bacterium]